MMFRKISIGLLLFSVMINAIARFDRMPEERRIPVPYEPRRNPPPSDEQWQNRARQTTADGRAKMSPDARRTLRQQIDSAGRDIYSQRR